jgi:hypothetical protein
MARQFLTGLNLNKNELLNARIQNLANDPSNPVLGQIYFNTSLNEMRVYNGTEFEAVGLNGVTASAAEINILDGATLTTTELNYVDGVTSAIQTQLDAKAPINNPAFTGTVSLVSDLVFEGATANDFETTVTATDPTADRTITLPDNSGTVILSSNTVNSLAVPTASFSMNSQKIVSLADPVDPQDAATKAYVDAARSGLDVKASVRVATTENVTLATGGSGLTVLSTFTAELNSSGTSISSEAVIFRLNSEEGYAVPPTYSVNDLITITNAGANFGEGTDIDGVVLKVLVADPGEIIVEANDPLDDTAFAAWSAAIAADAGGTANFPPPVVVSKVSLSSPTSGTTSVDGIELATGNRVLVKNQTNAAENGIYVVASSGSWLRATDADTSEKVTSGMFTFVSEGTVNSDSGWVLTTNDTITLGTTGLTFAQFSGAGQITAGNGLTKTGNTIDAVGTANRITVNADSIDIASTYVGQTSITTLGTIATGTWNGTEIGRAHV